MKNLKTVQYSAKVARYFVAHNASGDIEVRRHFV